MRIDDLNRTSPAYDGDRLCRYRALHDGGEAWEEQVETWLPKRYVEPVELYAERMALATYTNDVAPLVGLIPGYLFASPLTLKDTPDDPYWTQVLPDDATGSGLGFSSYMQAALTDAMVSRASYTWVDMPSRENAPEGLTSLQAREGGYLSARLVAFDASHLRRWWRGPGGALTAVLFRDEFVKDDGATGDLSAKPEPHYRWTYIDATVVREWEAPKSRDGGADIAPVREYAHGAGRLPVAELVLNEDQWAMNKLYAPALRLLRARNGLDWHRHQCAYAMLHVFSDRELSGLKGGDGWYVQFGKDDTAEWSAPPEHVAATLQDGASESMRDMYRVMRALFQAAADSAAAESAASKDRDWQAFGVGLVETADLVKDYARAVLQIVAARRGEKAPDLDVEGLDGWQKADPSALLDMLSRMPELKRVAPEWATKAIAKAQLGVIADEVDEADHDEIEKELEAWSPENEIAAGLAPDPRNAVDPAGGQPFGA